MADRITRIRALIAAGDAFTRDYLRRQILRLQPPVEVEETDNGIEALDFISNHQCDLLLVNLDLPGLGGLDLLRMLRADPAQQHVQIFVLTGVNSAETVRQAIAMGVTDYILKPYRRDVIGERLRGAVSRVVELRKAGSGVRRTSQPMKLLVADTDAGFVSATVKALTAECEVRSASNPGHLLSAMRRWNPDYLWLQSRFCGLAADLLLSTITALKLETAVYWVSLDSDDLPMNQDSIKGWIPRTADPVSLLSAYQRMVFAETGETWGQWPEDIESETIGAIQQGFGIMTGRDIDLVDHVDLGSDVVSVSLGLVRADDAGTFELGFAADRALCRNLSGALGESEWQSSTEKAEEAALLDLIAVVAGRLERRYAGASGVWTLGEPKITVPDAERPARTVHRRLDFQWQIYGSLEVSFKVHEPQ